MKISGAVVTGIVATVAMVGVLTAFIGNSSPYVTVAEAKQSKGDGLHLAGSLVKQSVQMSPTTGEIRFSLKDKDGAVANVLYKGSTPGNLMEATKVVAIGGMQGDEFVSRKLLIKCPSKYEGEQAGAKKEGA